jgi:hypothetical protein
MLKHILSPIAVARQRQAAHKASGDSSPSKPKAIVPRGRTPSHRPQLQIHPDASANIDPPLTGASTHPGWPEVTSPAADSKDQGDSTDGERSKCASGSEFPKSAVPHTASDNATSDHNEIGTPAREVPVSSEISYAVAIYPYMAELKDEFDVVVYVSRLVLYLPMDLTDIDSGDAFVIILRARGWWVVQRDPQGTGIVDSDTTQQGWVPAGCLLETQIPVSTAVAEANRASGLSAEPLSPAPITNTPILPLHIVSTSSPGYALMDYKKSGDEELDLFKDDVLRVFKRYNQWCYVRSFPVSLLQRIYCLF